MYLTRSGKQILDHNIITLVHRERQAVPVSLEEMVIEILEAPDLMMKQIIPHRYCGEMVYSLFNIMNDHTPGFPRIAGNAAFVLGSILEDEVGRKKVIQLLNDEKREDDTSYLLPSLTALIQTHELEAMTNASGAISLLLETSEGCDWALDQPSIDWMIFVLSQCLIDDRDLCVPSNCALSLARICMSEKGQKLILNHKESEEILKFLMASCGVDREGRGMNAAFALAYLCHTEEGTIKITDLKECIELQLALINMIHSVDDGCRKNAAFCMKTMSQWKNGQDSWNQDLDIKHMLTALCNMLSFGDESLGRMAAITLANLADRREGYMLQKDHSKAKSTLQHVLSQMRISDEYRQEAFTAMKTLMIPKPEPPQMKVLDAHNIAAEWKPVEAKSGAEVQYELYCDDKSVFSGTETSFTTRGLRERTEYEFRLRAFTEDDEESFVSESVIVQTFRAISSPPRNLRAVLVTSNQAKLVWEKPSKICGTLKGYYIQDADNDINFAPVNTYYIASNLKADKQYIFEVCAVTQRGRGEIATVTVQTLRQDYYAPSRPKLTVVGPHEMIIKWTAPVSPAGKINGYEVLQDGKSIYFGMNRKCIAVNLEAEKKYKFSVVAWTNEGRNESLPTIKKTCKHNQSKTKKWKNKDDLMKWLESKEEDDEDIFDADDSDNEPMTNQSVGKDQQKESANVRKESSPRNNNSGNDSDGSGEEDDVNPQTPYGVDENDNAESGNGIEDGANAEENE